MAPRPASRLSRHPARQPVEIAPGDKIRFQLRNDRLGVVNGTVATVTAVHTDPSKEPDKLGNVRRIEAVIDNRRISFIPADISDERGRARLGWAYASTVHGSQGMTVDRAIVLLDPHAVHVAASRARDETRLVVDRSQIDALTSSRLPLDRAQQAERHLPRSGAPYSPGDSRPGAPRPRRSP